MKREKAIDILSNLLKRYDFIDAKETHNAVQVGIEALKFVGRTRETFVSPAPLSGETLDEAVADPYLGLRERPRKVDGVNEKPTCPWTCPAQHHAWAYLKKGWDAAWEAAERYYANGTSRQEEMPKMRSMETLDRGGS